MPVKYTMPGKQRQIEARRREARERARTPAAPVAYIVTHADGRTPFVVRRELDPARAAAREANAVRRAMHEAQLRTRRRQIDARCQRANALRWAKAEAAALGRILHASAS